MQVLTNLNEASTKLVSLVDQVPTLGPVLFDTDKSIVKRQYYPMLDDIAAFLNARGGGLVTLTGHTDQRASDDYNLALGARRARAVYEALAERLTPETRSKLRVSPRSD